MRRLWLIIAAFLAVQVAIVCGAANGPFVDEALYAVAGMRVLEGQGLSDGYLAWFNGSPFVWPVIAAIGHRMGGLTGARLMAVLLSTVTLLAVAKTAETLFGPTAAAWATAALAVNGLFMALAHFAVYDVPALTGIAVSMWCLTRFSRSDHWIWLMAAAIAFAFAVISKYAYAPMLVPLAGLLVSGHRSRHLGRALAVFLALAGLLVAAYFLVFFGTPVPTSTDAYLQQSFRRTRGHIAVLQTIYGLAPFVLALAGAIVAWRKQHRLLAVTCLVALSLSPAFHVWAENFVSSQKHVVPSFLFAYLLAGVALERLWRSRSRATAFLLVTLLAVWGGVQWYWQEHSWSDTRPLATYLAQNMKRGERVLADSSWNYILPLYPRGLITSPSEVIDASYSPDLDGLDVCRIAWLVGADTVDRIRKAVEQCGHRRVLSVATRHYYFDTTQLRGGTYAVVVGLYRLPESLGSR